MNIIAFFKGYPISKCEHIKIDILCLIHKVLLFLSIYYLDFTFLIKDTLLPPLSALCWRMSWIICHCDPCFTTKSTKFNLFNLYAYTHHAKQCSLMWLELHKNTSVLKMVSNFSFFFFFFLFIYHHDFTTQRSDQSKDSTLRCSINNRYRQFCLLLSWQLTWPKTSSRNLRVTSTCQNGHARKST